VRLGKFGKCPQTLAIEHLHRMVAECGHEEALTSWLWAAPATIRKRASEYFIFLPVFSILAAVSENYRSGYG
jgi:hypothetical protein